MLTAQQWKFSNNIHSFYLIFSVHTNKTLILTQYNSVAPNSNLLAQKFVKGGKEGGWPLLVRPTITPSTQLQTVYQ